MWRFPRTYHGPLPTDTGRAGKNQTLEDVPLKMSRHVTAGAASWRCPSNVATQPVSPSQCSSSVRLCTLATSPQRRARTQPVFCKLPASEGARYHFVVLSASQREAQIPPWRQLHSHRNPRIASRRARRHPRPQTQHPRSHLTSLATARCALVSCDPLMTHVRVCAVGHITCVSVYGKV